MEMKLKAGQNLHLETCQVGHSDAADYFLFIQGREFVSGAGLQETSYCHLQLTSQATEMLKTAKEGVRFWRRLNLGERILTQSRPFDSRSYTRSARQSRFLNQSKNV